MASNHVTAGQHEIRQGIRSVQQGQSEIAGLHFLSALEQFDGVVPLDVRREELSVAAEVMLGAGFEDLALMAVLDALNLDDSLNLPDSLRNDRITCANIHVGLKNIEQAEEMYETILEECLKASDYSNAASASTNLASILADEQYYQEALQLIEKSLSYVKVQPFPDTELKTLLMKIQILEHLQGQAERTFDVIRIVLDRFNRDLPPPYRQFLVQSVDSACERFTLDSSKTDLDRWKKDNFPELFDL